MEWKKKFARILDVVAKREAESGERDQIESLIVSSRDNPLVSSLKRLHL
jgi:hypothetical protein